MDLGDFERGDVDHDDTDDDHDDNQGNDHVRTVMTTTWSTKETAAFSGAPTLAVPEIATRSFRAIGTMASVAVVRPERVDEALRLLTEDLAALDHACSRFRADSEIRRVEARSSGRPVPVGPLLFETLEVACAVAVRTAGIVDPTIGSSLIELGYDRDFDEITEHRRLVDARFDPAPGWWQIRLDRDALTVSIPDGVHIDLGATAKAFAADRAAQRIATALGCGTLVNLGGDVAISGHGPPNGWAVGIASSCTTPVDDVDVVLCVHSGGVATSGTTARTWTRDGRLMHHIVDPWTGEPALPVWSLVSTVAPSCVEANAWSTAAVVWGADAVGNLSAHGASARLVDARGAVTTVGQWPTSVTDFERPRR